MLTYTIALSLHSTQQDLNMLHIVAETAETKLLHRLLHAAADDNADDA